MNKGQLWRFFALKSGGSFKAEIVTRKFCRTAD
jgi:hypothetical protein